MGAEGVAGKPYGRRATDHEANPGWRPAALLTVGIALADWVTKWLIAQAVPLGRLVEVIDGRVAFWHVRNEAMILGLYGGLPLSGRLAITALAGVIGLLLLYEVVARGHRLPPGRRAWVWAFVGLAAGGMIGNMGQRAIHWYVTDFLSFRFRGLWLPPGNLADLALFVSVPIAGLVIWFEIAARRQRRPSAVTGRPAAKRAP